MDKTIKKLPIDDRPYEKLEKYGTEYLSNSELLAIIIKTGTKEKTCVELAQNIINKNKTSFTDLEYLSELKLNELKTFKGIGRVKAIQIKATFELCKRYLTEKYKEKVKIKNPEDIFSLLYDSYIDKKQEILKTVILNKSNKVIGVETNSIGTIDSTTSGIREIFSEPIKLMAASIILVHNHPSGSIKPSNADIKFTSYIKEYGKIFNIELIDHIIIAEDKYVSLKELGYIE